MRSSKPPVCTNEYAISTAAIARVSGLALCSDCALPPENAPLAQPYARRPISSTPSPAPIQGLGV